MTPVKQVQLHEKQAAPSLTIGVTALRRRLSPVMTALVKNPALTVYITVSGCPRLVVINFDRWSELTASLSNRA